MPRLLSIELFISECCDCAPALTVSQVDLWAKYMSWCALFGHTRLDGHEFDGALMALGYRRGALMSSQWKGLALKQEKKMPVKGAGL